MLALRLQYAFFCHGRRAEPGFGVHQGAATGGEGVGETRPDRCGEDRRRYRRVLPDQHVGYFLNH